jgi:hypothetical protein
MLYRKSDGSLIEINRKEFINDTNYYQEIYKHICNITRENIQETFVNMNVSDNEFMGNTYESINNFIKFKKNSNKK